MRDIDVLPIPKYLKDKLKEVGISRIDQLVGMSKDTLIFLGFSENEALKAIRTSWSFYEPEVKNALEIEEEREFLETPLQRLNEILGGGFRVGTINEVFGPFASGKTSFLITQAVISSQNGKVIFIDTEKTFDKSRAIEIADNRGIDRENLKNILVIRAPSSNELILLITRLWQIVKDIKDSGERVNFIAIDSLTSPFRADYVGLEHLVERQQKLNYCLRQLMRMAEIYKLVVIFSNQVVALPGEYAKWGPVGGHIVAHTSYCRIKFSKAPKKVRVGEIVDHPSVKEQTFKFIISEKGVEDLKKVEEE
ncbi:hypothetical protein DRN69_00230 [Candidatus Pacearchaeota archaeon]|nr:MAG: hypothetical protein DRN69_00230 [Candidatus Pacearchaeota archaeon]